MKRALALAAAALLAATLTGCGDDGPEKKATPLKVDWAGNEETPGCVYDEASKTVVATFTITGDAPDSGKVTVDVTAYADEDTSKPVGTASGTIEHRGTAPTSLRITVPVTAEPYVDIDGVASCSRDIS